MRYKLLFFTIFFTLQLFSQDVSQKKIFRSGLYYYYKTFGQNIEEAKKIARQGLMSEVTTQLAESSETSLPNKVYVNHIKFLIIPLREDNKIIAYVLKSDVTAAKQKKKFTVTEVVDTEQNNNNVEKVRKQQENIPEKKINEKKEPDSNLKINEKSVIKQESTTVEHYGKVLKSLLQCNTKEELINQMIALRSQGKIQTITNKKYMMRNSSENFNIVLINKETNKIDAFYKKNSTKNIKNNNNISKSDYHKYIQIWIRIL